MLATAFITQEGRPKIIALITAAWENTNFPLQNEFRDFSPDSSLIFCFLRDFPPDRLRGPWLFQVPGFPEMRQLRKYKRQQWLKGNLTQGNAVPQPTEMAQGVPSPQIFYGRRGTLWTRKWDDCSMQS